MAYNPPDTIPLGNGNYLTVVGGSIAVTQGNITPQGAYTQIFELTVTGGSGSPASPDRSIQINDTGSFGSTNWIIDGSNSLNTGNVNNIDGSNIGFGVIDSIGTIEVGTATMAFGYIENDGSLLTGNTRSTFVHGSVYDGGTIQTAAEASTAQGYASGATIIAQGLGSVSEGCANGLGVISSNSDGSYSGGYVSSNSRITAGEKGTFVHGMAIEHDDDGNPSTLIAEGFGSSTFGFVTLGGVITSGAAGFPAGSGAFATGFASGAANYISITGAGAFGGGYVSNEIGGGGVEATGLGSFAWGYIVTGGVTSASGNGSFALGDNVIALHDYSFVIGSGISSSQNDSMSIGFLGYEQLYIDYNEVKFTQLTGAATEMAVLSSTGVIGRGGLLGQFTAVQYATPTTGSTVTSDGSPQLILNPGGALLALTIAFPASPADGQIFKFCSTQAVTTLTLSGGTIAGALTTIATNGFASYVYSSSAAEWVRNG